MSESRNDPRPSLSLGKLALPVDIAFLRVAQSATAEVARLLSFDETQRGLLELAVEEAFTNAVQHFSRTVGADEAVHIEFSVEGDNFVITLCDRGIPFDIDEVKSYQSQEADKPGLGLTLIKKSVDRVELLSDGHEGKELRLVKRLPAGATLPGNVAKAGTKPRRERRTLELDSMVIRRPTEADLPAIRRLTWRCFGYNYATQFYDMKRLRDMFAGPRYVPVVAFDPASGEAVFHVALKLETADDAVPAEGMAYVDPTAHCPGLTTKATAFLHKIAGERGYKGLYMNTTANHVLSQRAATEAFGTQPCGLIMAQTTNNFAPVDVPISTHGKASVVVQYLVMDRSPSTVYLPSRHADMAAKIYGWLGLQRNLGEPAPSTDLPELSDIGVIVNPDSKYSVVNVRTIGRDCVTAVHAHLNDLRKQGSESITVRLAADTPAALEAAEGCEKLGLSFAGLVPCFFGGRDALLLQWIGVPLDMGQIKVYGDRGRELFAYVRNCLGY